MRGDKARDASIIAAHKAMVKATETAWKRDERATAVHIVTAKQHLRDAGFRFAEDKS